MRFHVITLFPEVIEAYAGASILGRAQKEKKLKVKTYQLRDYAGPVRRHTSNGAGKWFYKKVDDKPYGGGPGMVLRAEPVLRAVEIIQKKYQPKIILTSPGGKPLTNAYAKKLSKQKDVIIVCGRYEGLDARVAKILKAEEISAGPYVLTGGEVPALAIIDATARQIKGVLGKRESLEEGRIASRDVYTRPEVLTHKNKKYRVPKILLSGHQAKIEEWKSERRSSPK